uniref:Sushi domain-containing protein n=1 Tax=Ficedula albicollis TaxID=59894 RepID=A0A803VH29_FICAL
MALQWMFLLLLTPLLAAHNRDKPSPNTFGKLSEKGKCKAPSDWDSRLRFYPKRISYDLNEVVQLNCTGRFLPSVPQIQCISRGAQAMWNETATCKETCQQPQWDSQLQFSPNQNFYRVGEEVTLSCFLNSTPPLAVIRCANRIPPKQSNAWEVLAIGGTWHRLAQKLTCTMAKCPKPQWDAQLQFSESKTKYPQNTELTLTCPKGLEPSFPKVKCTKEFQRVSSGKPDYVDAWWGRNSRGAWTRIERDVLCTEGCQRPPWDSRLQLVPDQENYEKDQEVYLSCPRGFQPTYTEIKCQSEFQYYDVLIHYSLYKEFWHGRNSTGA